MPLIPRALPDTVGWLLVAVLSGLSLSYVTAEPSYDEAVYLQLARSISESGLPLRRDFEDFRSFRLFQNSPPLVLYVAAASQRFFPGRDIPTRLVHLGLFVVPTYVLVWLISRARFGAWAGVGALLALLGSGHYIRATTQVALDVPLGLLAILVLWAFERACTVESTPRRWSLVAGLALVLATWTKYQAICICVAIVAYCVYQVATRGRKTVRSLATPLAAVIAGGGFAIGVLLLFFLAFGGTSRLAVTVSHNAERMSTGPLGAVASARAVLDTGTEIVTRLGGAVLLLASLALVLQRNGRGWLVMLTGYVAATVAFNLWFFRLPGAGAHYLDSVVPSLALLAGPSAAAVLQWARPAGQRFVLGAAMFAIQFAGSPPPLYARYHNPSRMAAEHVASRGTPTAGVLANSVAIEFYAGNPVRVIRFVEPDLVFRSLEGTTANDVFFVVVDQDRLPPGVEQFENRWSDALARHFVLVTDDIPGTLIYERRRLAR